MKTDFSTKRKTLLDFIDHKAFDIILGLPPQTYTGRDKENFIAFKQQVQSEKIKIHSFRNPNRIKELFLREICSDTIRDPQPESVDLHVVSSLPEIRNEFIALCDKIGI